MGRYRVSIHAPRFREAMHRKRERTCPGGFVSIHAPRFREAMPYTVPTEFPVP